MWQETITQPGDILSIGLWMIERVLPVVTNSVKRIWMLQTQPGIATTLVTTPRRQLLRFTKVLDGVRQRGRTQTNVNFRLEGEHYVLH